MRVPAAMPARPMLTDQPVFLSLEMVQALRAQGILDFVDPRRIACLACCRGKAGFLACVARCAATGEACDGGLDNCTSC